jgi:hypothetical protein
MVSEKFCTFATDFIATLKNLMIMKNKLVLALILIAISCFFGEILNANTLSNSYESKTPYYISTSFSYSSKTISNKTFPISNCVVMGTVEVCNNLINRQKTSLFIRANSAFIRFNRLINAKTADLLSVFGDFIPLKLPYLQNITPYYRNIIANRLNNIRSYPNNIRSYPNIIRDYRNIIASYQNIFSTYPNKISIR